MPIKDKKHHKDLRSNEIVEEYLSITHLILLLLSITPTESAMRMQNEVILAYRKLFRDIVYDPAFVTSKSGPFSKLVEDAIDVLEDADLIHIKKEYRYEYRLHRLYSLETIAGYL